MKYTTETTKELVELYKSGTTTKDIAERFQVPDRSIIAKLSSLGVYQRKEYRNKRGEVPVKKEAYIDDIAAVLDVNVEILESLEKCNKNVLVLLLSALRKS